MKTVGQLLQSAREKHRLSLEDIEQETRIRVKYLQALESDQYDKLPSATYAKGFIQNYAQYLGLPANTLLAVFRRDFAEDEKGQIIPRSMVEPQAAPRFMWTPRITIATTVGFVLALFLGFLVYQFSGLIKPRLTVVTPQENEVILGPVVTVSGLTDPSNSVTVNDQLVVIKSDGSFETNLTLNEGEVVIEVEATNNYNNSTQVLRRFRVQSPSE